MRRYLLISSLLVVLVGIICNQHLWDSDYDRKIESDAKGYYAFLPALFIYQDFTYSFVDEMEMKYYPEDGSHAKHFRLEQPNGTVVNKCFPGTSIFYLPFFLLAAVFSALLNFPVDGYSVLFQWGIVAAHIFYYLAGISLLIHVMRRRGFSFFTQFACAVFLTFATNIYHYIIYDYGVAHIFGFFGCSLLIWLCHQYQSTRNRNYIGWSIVLLALLVITRPTNAMMLLVFPLFMSWEEIKTAFNPVAMLKNGQWLYVPGGMLVLFIAPLLWKIQTGNWLVYSYGNEKMDLLNPHLFDYLFSYIQGWFLWTPFMLFAVILGAVYFFRKNKIKGFIFLFGVLGIAYVFSCWWVWTFGMAMGQRPMIDFYPVIIIGFAGFINGINKGWLLLFLPFMGLNIVQSYQMRNGILTGGATTKEYYWSHFLQLKRDPSTVDIPGHWKEVGRSRMEMNELISASNPFSSGVTLPEAEFDLPCYLVVKLNAAGRYKETSATLVVTNELQELYEPVYLNIHLYKTPREMSYLFKIEKPLTKPLSCYIWNPDEKEPATINSLELILYHTPEK